MHAHKRSIIIGAIICVLFVIGVVAFILFSQSNQSDTAIESMVSSQPEITIEEIAKHNTAADCWTYVGGMVFDATNVIAKNTAHADYLVKACGSNGTTIFTVQKYTEQALDSKTITQLREQLGNYQIGLLSL